MMRVLVVVVCALAVSSACGGSEDTANEVRAQGAPGVPNIAITSPANGSKRLAGDVRVSVTVSNFELVPKKTTGPSEQGRGHVHYYLDAEQIPTAPGAPATLPDEDDYHVSSKTSYTWKDLDPGTHTFAVQLVNIDHTPLEPPITSAATVELTDPKDVTELPHK